MIIQTYFMEVNKNGVVYSGRMGEINSTCEAMEEYIGGYMRELDLRDGIVVLTEKTPHSSRNRVLVCNGKIEEILTGNLICVRKEQGKYISIREEDIRIIRDYLKPVFDLDGKLIIPQEEA